MVIAFWARDFRASSVKVLRAREAVVDRERMGSVIVVGGLPVKESCWVEVLLFGIGALEARIVERDVANGRGLFRFLMGLLGLLVMELLLLGLEDASVNDVEESESNWDSDPESFRLWAELFVPFFDIGARGG